ncbi:hypothetical protein [Lysinibacillus pakistanensis]|uniref:hypothetical protein n=1 Tax=Lysinibacillus pakistanensis TaxID=759811 RepID=UPI003D29541A
MNKIGNFLYKFVPLFLLFYMYVDMTYKASSNEFVLSVSEVTIFWGGFIFAVAFYFGFYKMPKIIEWMAEKRQREVD